MEKEEKRTKVDRHVGGKLCGKKGQDETMTKTWGHFFMLCFVRLNYYCCIKQETNLAEPKAISNTHNIV